MSAVIACLLLALPVNFAATVNSWPDGEVACFRQYIPLRPGFPNARCRHPIRKYPAKRELARSAEICCRNHMANGWGTELNCQSCSEIRGVLTPWSDWSKCSKTCGWGEQHRYRACSNNVCASEIEQKLTETRSCMWKTCCPVDGNWGDYSHWSECSATCGTGQQSRIRFCSSPSPSCGGKTCKGSHQDTRRCRIGSCATDGGWCNWTPWSPCSTSCQQTPGTIRRNRSCECPPPRNGGRDCKGRDGEEEICTGRAFCPVDGGWSDWSSWGACSAQRCSISPGVETKTRECSNPPPLYGGTCDGDAEESKPCLNLDKCRIEGVYEEWSAWNPCTTSCGSCGTRTRKRRCSHLFSAMAYIDIIGEAEFFCDETKQTEEQPCTLGECPDGSDPCGSTRASQYETHKNENVQQPFLKDGETASEDDAHYEYTNYVYPGEYDEETNGLTDVHEDYSGYDDEGHYNGSDQNDIGAVIQMLEEKTREDMKGFRDNETDYDDSVVGEPEQYWTGSGEEIPKDLLEMSHGHETVEPVPTDKPPVIGCVDNVLEGAVGEDAERAIGCCEILSEMFWANSDASAETDLVGLGEVDADYRESANSSLQGDSEARGPSAARIEECFALHFMHTVDMEDSLVEGRGLRRTCRYRGKGKFLTTICCALPCDAWPRPALRRQCHACHTENACPSCHQLLLSG